MQHTSQIPSYCLYLLRYYLYSRWDRQQRIACNDGFEPIWRSNTVCAF